MQGVQNHLHFSYVSKRSAQVHPVWKDTKYAYSNEAWTLTTHNLIILLVFYIDKHIW